MAKEGNFFLYFSKEELKTVIAKYGTNVKQDLLKGIKTDILNTAQQTESYLDVDGEIKQWKLRKLKAETQIKEHDLTHIKTFGSKPSPEARQAIAVGAKNNFEPVRSQPTNQIYSKPITQKDFDASKHCTVFQDMMKGQHTKCNYCQFTTAQSRDDSHQAISDIKSHLEQRHYGEVWK